MAGNLEKQLEAKRAELREAKRAHTAAVQAALDARNALGSVLVEAEATELVAKERVEGNRARALSEQVAQLEKAVIDLDRQQAAERMRALEAEASQAKDAAGALAWQFYEALEAARSADLALKDAQSKLSGHPHYGSGITPEVQTLSGILVRLKYAEAYAGLGTGPQIRRNGESKPAAGKSGGVKSVAAALAAAVMGG